MGAGGNHQPHRVLRLIEGRHGMRRDVAFDLRSLRSSRHDPMTAIDAKPARAHRMAA